MMIQLGSIRASALFISKVDFECLGMISTMCKRWKREFEQWKTLLLNPRFTCTSLVMAIINTTDIILFD